MDLIPRIMEDDRLLTLIGALLWGGIFFIAAGMAFWGYLVIKTRLCTQKTRATLVRAGAFKGARVQYKANDKTFAKLAPLRMYWGARWRTKPINIVYNPAYPGQILVADYSRKTFIYAGVVFVLIGIVMVLSSSAFRIIYF